MTSVLVQPEEAFHEADGEGETVMTDGCPAEDGGTPWPPGLPGMLPLLRAPEGCPGRVTVIAGSGRVPP